MDHRRIFIVAFLIFIPITGLACLGSYFLWTEHLVMEVWLPLFLVASLGYALAWYWQKNDMLLRPLSTSIPMEWTARDREAWQLVDQRIKQAPQIDKALMVDIDHYLKTAKEMAYELSRFYHPESEEPWSRATIPEILAVIEHACHDLYQVVDEYLPGGHMLTVKNWQQAKKVADWVPAINKAYWVLSAIFSPVNTATRYLASQVGMSTPFKALQENTLVFIYVAFLNRMGTYLIDLYSGRLRVGATRYRELKLGHQQDGQKSPAGVDEIREIAITIFGQVKAGKSSLVNALLGARRAQTAVVPETQSITRYELNLPDVPTRLVLLDTVGYAHAGPKADDLRATQKAAQHSDVLLLALHVRTAARQPDLQMLQGLSQWFRDHPELKFPPIIAVLTHIDLLSPMMEWSPPYDWKKPVRPKEKEIAQAVHAIRQELGPYLVDVIPICGAEGKISGVEEDLIPAIVSVLEEARAVAFVRCVRAEANAGKAHKIMEQLLTLSVQAGRIFLEGGPRP